MGANQSHNPENEISRLKLEEQNKLLREKIKNQELSNKLQVLQNLLEKQRIDSVIRGKSPNPLLTNPQLQKAFLQSPAMQKQFLESIQKNQNIEINENQYQQINKLIEILFFSHPHSILIFCSIVISVVGFTILYVLVCILKR